MDLFAARDCNTNQKNLNKGEGNPGLKDSDSFDSQNDTERNALFFFYL